MFKVIEIGGKFAIKEYDAQGNSVQVLPMRYSSEFEAQMAIKDGPAVAEQVNEQIEAGAVKIDEETGKVEGEVVIDKSRLPSNEEYVVDILAAKDDSVGYLERNNEGTETKEEDNTQA